MSTDKISAEDAEHLAAYNRVYLALDQEDRTRERRRLALLNGFGHVLTIADELDGLYDVQAEQRDLLDTIANQLGSIAENLTYLQ